MLKQLRLLSIHNHRAQSDALNHLVQFMLVSYDLVMQAAKYLVGLIQTDLLK
jgi:hypothetical protein